jgi:tetratricopeptide (TPR) repeat protein
MKLLELDAAAQQIKRACLAKTRPFVFIVGAGISVPPVPLASTIESECRVKATEWDAQAGPADLSALDNYSYWFARAYEQPIFRQEYLRQLIEAKPISHANFRLAHLLLDHRISNVVITPNFDDFLSRALTLFGKAHIVCDHYRTVERINPEQNDIQIIHVHGTYWFYDCCNLRDEIESRAKSSEQTNSTMAFKLDDIFSRRSPLVIGYSGWEGDVIMGALKRRLQNDLPYNLYWFCYKRSAPESMPEWLRSHPRVFFVVPSPNPPRTPEPSPTDAGLDARLKLAPNPEVAAYSATGDRDSTLAARIVFDRLLQTFEVQTPALTSDPLAFFADYLRRSLPNDDVEKAQGNIYYSFASVVERLERARQNEIIKESEDQIEKVRDGLRRSQYREAIEQGSKATLAGFNESQLREFMTAMFTAAASLDETSAEEMQGYQLVIQSGDLLSRRNVADDVSREKVAKALMAQADSLRVLHRSADAIAVYSEVVRRFEQATEPELRSLVAAAMADAGYESLATNDTETALSRFDAMIDRFGSGTETDVRKALARVLVNKGYCLRTLGRYDDAIVIYQDVIERFGDASDAVLLEGVARALTNKSYVLDQLQRTPEAIEAVNQVLERFLDRTEPALRVQVAWAFLAKAVLLSRSNQIEQAALIHQEIVTRFADDTEPGIRQVVAEALNSIGFRGLLEAKRALLSGEEPRYLELLLKAEEKIDAALVYEPGDPVILGNKGYVAFLSGKTEEARDILTRAIADGGEKIQQTELDDSHTDEIPKDAEFRALVLAIPLPEGETEAPRSH